MTGARTSTLATLRGSIERIETHGDACTPGRAALGHEDADATLQGGLALGAMHEVFTDAGRQSAAATGFVAGLAVRLAARRPLAAQASGVTGLLLRLAAEPQPSTAETRWIVRAAHSPPASHWSAWGAPVFDAQLVRNRHGPVGRWIMEWKCDECLFSKPAAYPQPVAAAPAHRPHQAPARARQRRAG